MEYYLGMIFMWPIGWEPIGFMECNGQMLQISEYTSLYALLGPTFGGDGRVTFRLPDLRGRVPIGIGTPPHGSTYLLGWYYGLESYSIGINQANLPEHTHQLVSAHTVIPSETVDLKMKVSTDIGERAEAQENDYLAQTSKITGKSVNLYRSDATNSVDISGIKVKTDAQTINGNGHVSMDGGGKIVDIPTMQPYLGMAYYICVDGLFPSRN